MILAVNLPRFVLTIPSAKLAGTPSLLASISVPIELLKKCPLMFRVLAAPVPTARAMISAKDLLRLAAEYTTTVKNHQ